MIKLIDINKIGPHPNNPRKELGDLTELAESIKVQGVLQNLTVVPREPGYCISCKLWNGGVGKCTEGHDTNERPPCSKWESDGSYTVIIGHRRLAAAKMAGLNEVPCAIVDMSPQEQIATMLLENMQRSDLTVYEQAQGFQMMLDLGETIANIAEKTGFSETTVRRRIKLLELDQEKLKASVARGATIMDYVELEKIENIELRNKVLESIGTPNFKWELQRAIDKERDEKNMALLLEQLDSFAIKVDNGNGLRYIRMYYARDYKDFKKPDDAGETKYFYTVSNYGYVTLYAEAVETAEDEEAKKREEQRQALRNALTEASRRAYQLRREFVSEISNTKAKKNMAVIIEYLLRSMIDTYINISYEEIAEFLNIKLNEDAEDELSFDIIAEQVASQPERCLLIVTYLSLDSENEDYFDWRNDYRENENLDMVYDFLEKLGYEMSDDEQALKNGTHELFAQDDEDIE